MLSKKYIVVSFTPWTVCSFTHHLSHSLIIQSEQFLLFFLSRTQTYIHARTHTYAQADNTPIERKSLLIVLLSPHSLNTSCEHKHFITTPLSPLHDHLLPLTHTCKTARHEAQILISPCTCRGLWQSVPDAGRSDWTKNTVMNRPKFVHTVTRRNFF